MSQRRGAPRGACRGKAAKSSDITNVNIMRKQWGPRWKAGAAN